MTQSSTTETGLTIVIAPDEVDSRRDQAVLDVDLRAFFDLSPELLCVAGFDLYFKYLNPAWERVLGWTIDELMAAPLLDFVHPEDRRRAAEDTAKVTKEAGSAEYVNRYRHADGSYRWLSWTATTAADSDLFYAAARDITEDRRREQKLQASEERFRSLIQSAPGGILISDDGGSIIFANELVEEMFGYGPGELIGEPVEILVPEALRASHATMRTGFHRKPEQRQMGAYRDLNGVRSDGREFPVAVGLAPLPGEGGLFVAATITDMTEQRRFEQKLIRANAELEARIADLQRIGQEADLVSEMAELLQASQTDEEAHRVIERYAARLFTFGAGAVSLINESRNTVVDVVSWDAMSSGEETFEPVDCWALRLSKVHAVRTDTTHVVCPHIEPLDPPWSLCVPLLAQGEALGVLTVLFEADAFDSSEAFSPVHRLATSFADHIALSLSNLRLRNRLQIESIRDPVTGLFNRRHLVASLEREIARATRHESGLGVIMFDIDHFKHFNDTYGHGAGDAALATIGQTILSLVRAEDIPSRYGGEEFVIVLPGATLQHAADRAEQMRSELGSVPLVFAGRDLGQVSLSGGIAAFPDHGLTPESLIHAADRALYRAKDEGRDRLEIGDPG